MEIVTIIEKIGLFAVGSGIIAWTLKSIYKNVLDKDIEKYKYRLQQEQITSSKLYDERAQVINNLYELLNDFDRKMHSLTCPLQLACDLPEKEKRKHASKAGQKFVEYYSKKKIYFSKETAKLLDEINKEFEGAWINLTIYPSIEIDRDNINRDKWELWMKSWKIISKKIPPLKEKIEDEFREILGVYNKPKNLC